VGGARNLAISNEKSSGTAVALRPRHRGGDVGAMADHLGADIDQLVAQAASDYCSARACDIASIRMKLPRL